MVAAFKKAGRRGFGVCWLVCLFVCWIMGLGVVWLKFNHRERSSFFQRGGSFYLRRGSFYLRANAGNCAKIFIASVAIVQ